MRDEEIVERLRSLVPSKETADLDGIILRRARRIRQRRWVASYIILGILLIGGGTYLFAGHSGHVTVSTASGLNGSGGVGLSPSAAGSPTATPSPELSPSLGVTQLVSSSTLGISLQLPASWHINATYAPTLRYEGPTGYVEIAQFRSPDPNQLCQAEANHVVHPYGSQPTVVTVTVAGRSACLVMPSADAQLQGGFSPSFLAVSYPQPTSSWASIGIFADEGHIRSLAAAMAFSGVPGGEG